MLASMENDLVGCPLAIQVMSGCVQYDLARRRRLDSIGCFLFYVLVIKTIELHEQRE
jgi:hypothetical protein